MTPSDPLDRSTTPPIPARPFPTVARAGIAVMAFGVLLDVVEHGMGPSTSGMDTAAFSLGEHLAHLVVLVGMALVIGGIVRDGMRAAGRMDRPATVGRPDRPDDAGGGRQKRSSRDAIR
jgi:hypothetical protein